MSQYVIPEESELMVVLPYIGLLSLILFIFTTGQGGVCGDDVISRHTDLFPFCVATILFLFIIRINLPGQHSDSLRFFLLIHWRRSLNGQVATSTSSSVGPL